MANNCVAGLVYIKVDGRQLSVRANVTIGASDFDRQPIVGLDGRHGYSKVVAPVFIECQITNRPQFPLTDLRNVDNATVTAELENGETWVLREAFQEGTLELAAGDGTCTVRFGGMDIMRQYQSGLMMDMHTGLGLPMKTVVQLGVSVYHGDQEVTEIEVTEPTLEAMLVTDNYDEDSIDFGVFTLVSCTAYPPSVIDQLDQEDFAALHEALRDMRNGPSRGRLDNVVVLAVPVATDDQLITEVTVRPMDIGIMRKADKIKGAIRKSMTVMAVCTGLPESVIRRLHARDVAAIGDTMERVRLERRRKTGSKPLPGSPGTSTGPPQR